MDVCGATDQETAMLRCGAGWSCMAWRALDHQIEHRLFEASARQPDGG